MMKRALSVVFLCGVFCAVGCKKKGSGAGPVAANEAATEASETSAGPKENESVDGPDGASDESSADEAVEGSSVDTAENGQGDKPKETTSPAPSKPKKAPRPAMNASAKGAYEAGQKAFAAGDLQGAKAQYSKATKADANAYEAHRALGAVHERLGNEGAAAKSYRWALKVVPDDEESIAAYAILQARQKNYDAALATLQKGAEATGPSAAILAAKAEVKSLQGQSGQAQGFAQDALKLDPSYKPAMLALARDHYRARRIDLALYALTGILDGYGEGNPPRDKNNAEARLLRGIIYSERGLRGPAMEEMEKALEERPDLVAAHLVLANYMMEAGNAKDARVHLEQAVRYDNKNLTAHLQLGDAYRLLGRTEDARRELEWVLAAEPNQAAAHYNLGLLFLLSPKVKGMTEQQALDKSIEHLEAYKARAQRGGPDDVDDLITRAKTNKALLKAKAEEG